MFSYFLSVAIAFIVFGTVFNFLKGINSISPDSLENKALWIVVGFCSILWFIAVPILFVIFIMFLLKKLTDKISQVILKRVKK